MPGDSQLVINQMTGARGINHPALWQLNYQATTLAKRIAGGVRYRWIPREENQMADTLAGGQLAQATTPLVAARAAWCCCGASGAGRADRAPRMGRAR